MHPRLGPQPNTVAPSGRGWASAWSRALTTGWRLIEAIATAALSITRLTIISVDVGLDRHGVGGHFGDLPGELFLARQPVLLGPHPDVVHDHCSVPSIEFGKIAKLRPSAKPNRRAGGLRGPENAGMAGFAGRGTQAKLVVMTPIPYVHRYQVGFSDTDAAAIVFTGRFPNFALDAIEGWFRDRLGTDWFRLNNDLGTGTPFVHVSVDLQSPLTPRDVLLTTVRLIRLGRSSLEFRVEGRTEAEARLSFTGRFVCVFIDTAARRSIEAPEAFRAALAAELAVGASPVEP